MTGLGRAGPRHVSHRTRAQNAAVCEGTRAGRCRGGWLLHLDLVAAPRNTRRRCIAAPRASEPAAGGCSGCAVIVAASARVGGRGAKAPIELRAPRPTRVRPVYARRPARVRPARSGVQRARGVALSRAPDGPGYDEHMQSPYLDIGVGTGYLLDKCRPPTASPDITLMGLNPNPLAFASKAARSLPAKDPQQRARAIRVARGLLPVGRPQLASALLPGDMASKASSSITRGQSSLREEHSSEARFSRRRATHASLALDDELRHSPRRVPFPEAPRGLWPGGRSDSRRLAPRGSSAEWIIGASERRADYTTATPGATIELSSAGARLRRRRRTRSSTDASKRDLAERDERARLAGLDDAAGVELLAQVDAIDLPG